MSISTRKLYAGNLLWDMTEEELREIFADYGNVVSVKLITWEDGEEHQYQHKGYGFVEMATEREAEEALKKLQGTTYKGRNLIVREAHPKTAMRRGILNPTTPGRPE